MRRIKVLLLVALLTPSVAHAQFEWVDTFSDFGDQLAQWCPVAENFNLGVTRVGPSVGSARCDPPSTAPPTW